MDDNTLKQMNRGVIEEFRANHGKVGGRHEGMSLLLLTTTGAKSGQPRVSPLAYLPDGDRFVIIAAKGGSPTHPDWFFNIEANPDVTVEVGDDTFPARAVVAGDAERARLYKQFTARFTQFPDFQANTSRVIPVVVLERTAR